MIEHALKLAEIGFHVLPVSPNSKIPALKNFPEKASRDAETIKRWWKKNPKFNVGISTTKFNDGEGLVVIDVDDKNGKCGSEEVLKLELQGFEFPKTYTQTTPSGGTHYFYRTKSALKQGVSVLAPGIDIRSKGGQVVGAGSTINGVPYTSDDNPIAELPDWIRERLGKAPKEKVSSQEAKAPVNGEYAVERAIFYLTHEAPVSVEGEGGDQTAFRVACHIKDMGIEHRKAYVLMSEYWNPNCLPPWSTEELFNKVENAFKYGKDPVGVAAPEADFSPVTDPKEEVLDTLKNINKNFAVIYIDGKPKILWEAVDFDGKRKISFITEHAFLRMFSNRLPPRKKRDVRKTFGTLWLEDWPERREYQGIVFAPEQKISSSYYNLWRGFSVEPLPYSQANAKQQKGFDLFLDHALKNVCRGNEEHFNWLMGYFAHMIQKPWERPLTTLVFQGSKGTGKNALIDRVGSLFLDNGYAVAHSSRFLTSNFNGHLEGCLCLVLDEAFWSGDKAADGALKGLTTSPKMMIERKGCETYQIKNLVRVVIIGNEEWLVPASADERRYAVFEMGEGRKQDTKYFHDMRVCLDELGGNRVLLDYFKTFDLSKVEVSVAPKTDALTKQKFASLEPFEQWWFDCLREGYLVGGDFGGEWPERVAKRGFLSSFSRYSKERGIYKWLPSQVVAGRLLKKFCPQIDTNQKTLASEGRDPAYGLPQLFECRKSWEKYLKTNIQWEGGE